MMWIVPQVMYRRKRFQLRWPTLRQYARGHLLKYPLQLEEPFCYPEYSEPYKQRQNE